MEIEIPAEDLTSKQACPVLIIALFITGLALAKIQHKKMRALISEKLKLSIPKDNIYEVALRL
jgi:cell division protein FtsL